MRAPGSTLTPGPGGRARENLPASPGLRGLSPLAAVAAGALDPAYRAAAAARRAEAAAPAGAGRASGAFRASGLARAAAVRRRPARLATVALAATVGLLLAGAAGTWRAGDASREHVDAALAVERDLRAADVVTLTGRARTLSADVDAARAALALAEGEQRAVASALGVLEPAAAARPANGPGLRVEIVDATPGQPGTGPAGEGGAGRLTDRDLAELVNALWSGHASAIAVGGVRLAPTSAIRTAGQAILVGFQPVASPYRIDAVGDPARLLAALLGSDTGRRLAAGHLTGARLRATTTMRDLTVPAALVTPPRLARRQSQ
ncbi:MULTISPECIES: DUF881 domain-containing protein [Pseudofrankia]|uniref:DUF881 domain-containing protein n=1 Tax=Pseudofrankia TaxID=2994363 RepID=UPI0022B8054A|nr:MULTISPECIES: DUF881 domain-containing protein [Pseudofrankia]